MTYYQLSVCQTVPLIRLYLHLHVYKLSWVVEDLLNSILSYKTGCKIRMTCELSNQSLC